MHVKNDLSNTPVLQNDTVITRQAGSSTVQVNPLFSYDSKYLITVQGSTIKLISVITGECVQELRAHKQNVTSIKINATNKFQLYSSSQDKTIIKWNYLEQFPLKTYKLKVPILAIYTIPNEANYLMLLVNSKKRGNALWKYNLKTSKKTEIFSNCAKTENSITVGIEGLFFASVCEKTISFYNTVTKNTNTVSMSDDKFQTSFTCISSHPTELCVATGTRSGMIHLWHDFLSTSLPRRTLRHWHSLAVGEICFSPEGSTMFSGGMECVLVKWSAVDGNESRDYLPRLGAPIVHVCCSPDASLYATCHQDNSIRMITNNFHVRHILQGLVHNFSSVAKGSDRHSAQLAYDHRTKSMVTTGTPGHLQFYDINKDKHRFNLDIVAQNYVSSIDEKTPLLHTDVELYAFNHDGTWMVTYERRDDGITTSENRLKFWYFNASNQSYELNTLVECPHRRRMNDLKFKPKTRDHRDSEVLVTTSRDGDYKMWTLTEDNDIYRDNECWRCYHKGSYRGSCDDDLYHDLCDQTKIDSPQGHGVYAEQGRRKVDKTQASRRNGPSMWPDRVQFSEDASLLAISFHADDPANDIVTIWNAVDNEFKCVIENPCKERILGILFGKGRCKNLLLVHTVSHLCVWDLFTCSIVWYKQESANLVTLDEYSDFIAVFTNNKQLKIMNIQDSEVLYYFDNISSSQIHSAVFISNPNYTDNGRNKSRSGHGRGGGRGGAGVKGAQMAASQSRKPGDKGKHLKSMQKQSQTGKKTDTSTPSRHATDGGDGGGVMNGHGKTNGLAMEVDEDDVVRTDQNGVNGFSQSVDESKCNSLAWQQRSRLYFMNSKQELLTLEYSLNEIRRIIESQPTNISAENDKTIFTRLLTNGANVTDEIVDNVITTGASKKSLLLNKIINSSPSTMPPIKLMLKSFLDEMFTIPDISDQDKDKQDLNFEPINDHRTDVESDTDNESDFEVVENPIKQAEDKRKSPAIDLEIPILSYLKSLSIQL